MIKLIIMIALFYWGYKEYKPRVNEFLNKKTEFSVGGSDNNKNDKSNNKDKNNDKENSLVSTISDVKNDIKNVNDYVNNFKEMKAELIEKIRKAYEKFTRK